MGGSRTFQALLLIPTDDNQLYPLTSDELPRVLLPVGGRPLLSYNLELLESCNVQSVLLVIVGADSAAASRISGWVAQNFHERLPGLEIAVVSEAVGSADALRSIFHRIADVHDLLVLFADVLTDVPLGSVAAAHRREDAALTIVFNDRDGLAGGSDGAAGGTGSGGDARSGDKGKKGGASGGGSGGKSGGGGADSAAASAAAAAAGAGGGGAGGGGAAAGKAAAAVHESVSLAAKATIGPHCMVGEGTSVGEKSSIKRSIIGRHCRIGAHVKLVNSVIMDHVTIGDGCLVQGSVVSSNVLMQERTSVVDCYVGPGFVVGKDYKESELSKKPKAQAAQS
ncbi:unnamed protein product [Closterium sp. NIES-64]|nr:unnamed protein product [Closterium sp. NIES-65]CAI5993331.1 unnamed protein product [Closterium sp. NIES-64]